MYDNKVLIMLEDAGSMTSYVPYFKIILESRITGSLVIIGKVYIMILKNAFKTAK